jgi:hypothetical protein
MRRGGGSRQWRSGRAPASPVPAVAEKVLFKCRISSVTLPTRLFPIVDLPEAVRHRSRLNPAGSGILEKKTPGDSM